MTSIQLRNNLTDPHAGKKSPLYPLIAGKTRLPEDFRSSPGKDLDTPWPAQWWGLNGSTLFQKLSSKAQKALIDGCNQALLKESYFIEKSGLAYTAKMILLAESTDVAQLYALIAAEEARHLAWIEPYIRSEDKTRPSGQFLAFLMQLIEDIPPRLLVYLVQIILEGWGLDHYKRLLDGCEQSHLKQILSYILKDEALHNRSGYLLFDPHALCPDDLALIGEALKSYAEMVRVGPQACVLAADQAVGGLSLSDVEELFSALRHEEETARKLALLQGLMRQRGLETMVDGLEQRGYFLPMTNSEAARAYLLPR